MYGNLLKSWVPDVLSGDPIITSSGLVYPGLCSIWGWCIQVARMNNVSVRRVGSQTQVTIRLLRKSNHIVGNSIQWGRKPLRKKSNRCSIRRQDEMLVCDCDSDTLVAQHSSYMPYSPDNESNILIERNTPSC